ncbi:MAG: T9SS type A sorting domain-containing protein [Ignavibacterium sp.]|jgi:hypothetical protein|nr:T9SS type A sorting domain-containing protein [Ignavibacterium sp.]
MKINFYLFVLLTFLLTNLTFSQEIWINEFSYNCADSLIGVPEGDEFVEIVAPVGTDMSQYGLILYYYENNDAYYTYSFSRLSGIVTSVNQSAGKGYYVVLTENSYRLEKFTPIPEGVSFITIDTRNAGFVNTEGGILLVHAESGEVIHGVSYEMPKDIDLPISLMLKLEEVDFEWATLPELEITSSTVDAIKPPLKDDGNSPPYNSIKMIGSGFSRMWTTTTGKEISTPGSLNYNQSALPVELSSFFLTAVSNGVKLKWITETETNNFGFEVERKTSNTDWSTLGFVNGNGNSNSPKEYSYIDNVKKNDKYSYRLKQIDNTGQFAYSKIEVIDFTKQPQYNLTQNYPNPFNPSTSISFTLPRSEVVRLTVYNLLGQKIKTLIDEFKEAGVHYVNFEAKDLNSGIYIYTIETVSFTQTRKMTLIK